MQYNTDLAMETREKNNCGENEGVIYKKEKRNGAVVTLIDVINAQGEKAIGKPAGRYITVEMKPFCVDSELFDGRLDAVSDEIKKMLPKSGTVLVAGLGNDKITPDALGPRVIDFIMATRHINSEIARQTGLTDLRSVAAIAPGVLGETGMETGEIISAVARSIGAKCVIAIDALASLSVKRLGRTVQISNTGITPGSGIGNHRFSINEKNLGIPVIAIGMPTVVDALTLVEELSGKEIGSLSSAPGEEKMIVTPKEIDTVIEKSAKMIAMAINAALQPSLSPEDIFSLVG